PGSRPNFQVIIRDEGTQATGRACQQEIRLPCYWLSCDEMRRTVCQGATRTAVWARESALHLRWDNTHHGDNQLGNALVSEHVHTCRGPLRTHADALLRKEWAAAAAGLPRPVAELRAHHLLGAPTRDRLPRLRPRHHPDRPGQ